MKIGRLLKYMLRRFTLHFGYDIVLSSYERGNIYNRDLPQDFSHDAVEVIHAVKPYTMTSPARVHAMIQAVKYVASNQISGDIVECGVWKGGSMMAAALTLMQIGDCRRTLHLYDTFEGMTQPGGEDVNLCGQYAADKFEQLKGNNGHSEWCLAQLDSVKKALYSTGYNPTKIRFIQGKVEDTLPKHAPEVISVLRLDTDWYESTRHELVHLYPRLSPGGILILDDYGHWAGVRKAMDEYIAENHICVFLGRIDYSGRLVVKPI